MCTVASVDSPFEAAGLKVINPRSNDRVHVGAEDLRAGNADALRRNDSSAQGDAAGGDHHGHRRLFGSSPGASADTPDLRASLFISAGDAW